MLFSQQFGHNSTAVLSRRIVSHINRTSWWTRHTKADKTFEMFYYIPVYMSKVSYVVSARFIYLKKGFRYCETRVNSFRCVCVGSKAKLDAKIKTFAISERNEKATRIDAILNFFRRLSGPFVPILILIQLNFIFPLSGLKSWQIQLLEDFHNQIFPCFFTWNVNFFRGFHRRDQNFLLSSSRPFNLYSSHYVWLL